MVPVTCLAVFGPAETDLVRKLYIRASKLRARELARQMRVPEASRHRDPPGALISMDGKPR